MAASVLSAPMASIGVPKEIKLDEQRVALTPDAVRELVSQGLEVRIETGAGAGAGIGDDAFAAAGAQLVSRDEAWGLTFSNGAAWRRLNSARFNSRSTRSTRAGSWPEATRVGPDWRSWIRALSRASRES